MLLLEVADLERWLAQHAWVFVRVGAFVMAAPVLGTQVVPARIRLILALLATLAIAPGTAALPVELSAATVVLVLQQLLVGLALAFFLQVLIHLFVMAGQMMAMQMGLGFASMMDPANGINVTVLSQFFLLLATLLFLALDGHLAMLAVLAESLHVLPVEAGLPTGSLYQLTVWGSWLFGGALQMALPVVTSDRKSTRLNSSHVAISYAVFCMR